MGQRTWRIRTSQFDDQEE